MGPTASEESWFEFPLNPSHSKVSAYAVRAPQATHLQVGQWRQLTHLQRHHFITVTVHTHAQISESSQLRQVIKSAGVTNATGSNIQLD